FISRKYIYMVPGDSIDKGNMGLIPHEFGPSVNGGAQVFVAFYDYKRSIGQLHAVFKARNGGTNCIIKFKALFMKGVHDHGGYRGFTMAARNYHSFFVPALLIDKFGKAYHF